MLAARDGNCKTLWLEIAVLINIQVIEMHFTETYLLECPPYGILQSMV